MSEVVGVASRSHSDMFMIVLRGYISRSRDRNLDGLGSGHGPPINVSGSGWIHLGYCIVISDRYAGVRGEKDRPVMHCGPHERVGCLPSLFLLVHSVGFKTLHPARFLCTGCTHMALAIITKAKGGRNCKIQARVCYTCLLQLPKESFSKRQWRPERDNDQMYSGEAPAAEDSPAQSPEK